MQNSVRSCRILRCTKTARSRTSADGYTNRIHATKSRADSEIVYDHWLLAASGLLVTRKGYFGEDIVTVAEGLKAHTKYLWFNTKKRREYIRITDDVQEFLEESGLKEGFILVSAMHITAGVYINDWEDGLIKDIDEWLERLAPANPAYHHHNTGEDNGDAHLKRILINHQVMVPVTEGKLDLGTWEQIYYAEFDGQRKKRLILKAIGI